MIVVIEEPVLNVDLIEDVVMDWKWRNIHPPGITTDTLTEAGSLIVASAARSQVRQGANADGLVWTSKLDEPQGIMAGSERRRRRYRTTNKSGTSQTAGTVVIWDADNDTAFTTTTNQRDRRVAGVLSDISNNSAGKVAVAGKRTTVKSNRNCAARNVVDRQFYRWLCNGRRYAAQLELLALPLQKTRRYRNRNSIDQRIITWEPAKAMVI